MAKIKPHTNTKTSGTKRKHEEDSQPSIDDQNKNSTTHTPKKSRTTETTIDTSLSTLSPTSLSTKFTQTIKKHKPDLSPIELEDLTLPPTSFRDTTPFTHPRNLSNLSAFLVEHTPGGADTLRLCTHKANPHTLLFTSSAIRCTDLLRAVREFGSEESKIAKLFAKHMKLGVMEKYVRETKFGIAAGTPARVLDLVKGGALGVEALKRVVIDGSYVDEKGRSVFEERETFLRVLEFLNLEVLKGRLVKGDVEVLVF